MDYMSEKMTLTDVVCDDTGERILECDFIVPDYYPDILQIVATEAVPHMRTKKMENGKITVEGFTEFRVFYISEEGGKLCSISYPQDFSMAFDVSNEAENPYVRAHMWVTSATSRALNPRKLAPKATVTTNIRAWDTKQQTPPAYDEDKNIEVNASEIEVFCIESSSPKITTISEDAQIPSSFPQARSILRNDCFVSITDVKSMTDKAIVKGNSNVRVLYSCDEDATAEVEFELPFTHIIEMENIDDTSDIDVDYDVSDIICSLKQDDEGENRLIAIDIELCGTARNAGNKTFNAITDVYSTEYNCNTKSSPMRFETMIAGGKKHMGGKADIETDRDTAEIITCYGNMRPLSAISDSGVISCSCEMNVTVIAKSTEGEYFAINKKIPITVDTDIKSASNERFEQDVALTSLNHRLNGQRNIEVKYELDDNVSAFSRGTLNAISEIDIDESTPKIKPRTSPVTIYFGKKDERLWDIAKKYNSTVSAIADANDIIPGKLSTNEILIIPKRTY